MEEKRKTRIFGLKTWREITTWKICAKMEDSTEKVGECELDSLGL
jgi:hypothetical protein